MRLWASENGTQLVQSGKWKWFCDMFNSWRAKWLILNYSVLEITILFYFVDYRIPLSQIKIVLFILANRECLIRRRRCINIVFIFAGQWKARVICSVLILENFPWCVLPLWSKYWERDKITGIKIQINYTVVSLWYCEVCHLSPIWGEGGKFFILYIYLYVSENTIVDIHFCIVIRNIVSFEFRMN